MKTVIVYILLIILVQKSFAQNGLCFTQPQSLSFPLSANLSSCAKSDFNSDGKEDICAISNNGISLLLSNSISSYTALTTYNLPMPTNAVIAEDFNNDGNSDIVAVNTISNTVFVILGTGTGTVLSINSFTLGSQPISLTSADFNNDGNMDLAITNYLSNNVSIYNGLGNGNFNFIANYNVGAFPSIVVSGDFNNDNNVDLIVNSNNSSVILKGNGTSSFIVSPFNNLSADNLIVADVNNDNKLDLLYTTSYGPAVSILTNIGNYQFNSSISYSLPAGYSTLTGLYTDDLNNDGNIDFTCTSSPSTSMPCNLEIFYGTGAGQFSGPASFSVSANSFNKPLGFIPVFIDNDNKLDVLVFADNLGLRLLYSCNVVGLNDSSNHFSATFYPNPVKDKLNIEFKEINLLYRLTITNVIGDIIYSGFSKNLKEELELSYLKSGLYYLKAETEKDLQVVKIVKE